MGMKFRMGCSLSMGFTELNFCIIFIPKFSKLCEGQLLNIFLLGNGDSDIIIITNTIIYIFIYLFILNFQFIYAY